MKTYMKALLIAGAICSLILLSSCKKTPGTGTVGATTAPENQLTLPLDPCADGHTYVDGFCTECGKEFSSEGLEYVLSEDGTYYIVKNIGSCTDTSITVPSIYNNKPVREIGNGAFKSIKSITSVTFSNEIIKIGDNAFDGCVSLVSINLPDSLTSIGKEAFNGCTSLSGELRIPDKITVIEDRAFYGCEDVESLILPKALTKIGDGAFSGLSRVRTLSIPESLTHVGEDAFSSFRLDSVCITSFNAWCSIEFENLRSNPMVNLSVGYTHGAALVINGEAATAFVMGDDVKSIKNYTFAGCSSLSRVVFSKKLEHIGDGAFYGCTSLQEAILPDSLTYLGKEAFVECTELKTVRLPAALDEIKESTFSRCSSLTEITIPGCISVVKEEAFADCTKLSEISYDGTRSEWDSIEKADNWDANTVRFNVICSDETISVRNSSEGLKFFLSEEKYADVISLYQCTDTEVTIPAKYNGMPVKGIFQSCFANAKNVTKITIPQSVSRILVGAFEGCSSLVSINIPKGVTVISASLFEGCSSLTDIYYAGTKEEFIQLKKESLWDHGTTDFTVHCSDGDLDKDEANNIKGLVFTLNSNKSSYSFSETGSYTGSRLEIPAEYNGLPVTAIKKAAFNNIHSIYSVILPEGIITIADGAFSNSGIREISIPSTLKTVYYSAFSSTGITKVHIASVESWCNISFSDKEGNPAHNGADLYLNGELVTEIVISDIAKGVGQYQFYGCRSIEKVTIDKAITRIGTFAFAECYRLKEIILPDTLTTIHSSAFENCYSLDNVTVPSSVSALTDSIFKKCLSLRRISLPRSMKSIQISSFSLCPLIEEINYGGTVAEWKSISSGVSFKNHGSIKIKCIDGEVEHSAPNKTSILFSMESVPGKDEYSIVGIGGCTDTELIISTEYSGKKVTSIGANAFCEKYIHTVHIKDGITSIGECAFMDTRSTNYIRIPKSVTEIGPYALYNFRSYPCVTLYDGTIAEWNKIIGVENSGASIVICTDGLID